MRVEHFDSDTQAMNLLEDDRPAKHAPAEVQLRYWEAQYEYLKEAYKNMPRTKERQQVALLRDEAQRNRNLFRGKVNVGGSS